MSTFDLEEFYKWLNVGKGIQADLQAIKSAILSQSRCHFLKVFVVKAAFDEVELVDLDIRFQTG